MVRQYHGTYKVHKIGKSENGIHMPATITGEYAIFADEKADIIILRRAGVFNMEKFLRDMDKIEKEEEFVPLEDVARDLGLGKR